MRAIQMEQFGDPAQVLRVVDIEEPPPPGPHEVLLSVEFSPLNKHGPLVVIGALAQPPLPHIPGAEGVARIRSPRKRVLCITRRNGARTRRLLIAPRLSDRLCASQF
jgi:NADPH:quinone reductase-like Zn-dependent oxidoreductase